MIADLSEDLRFGLRMLTKRPAFAIVAILSLALGIGANTAMFTLLDAVFIRPLAVESPERLVHVRTVDDNSDLDLGAVSRDNLRDLREQVSGFEGIEAEVGVRVALQSGGEAEPILAAGVTDGFFDLLGIEPARGRWITGQDEGSDTAPRAVLAHHLWQDRFHADPHILGRQVRISGVDFEVVGIASAKFTGLTFPIVPQVWVHVDQTWRLDRTLAGIFSRRGLTHHVVARLAPGRRIDEVQARVHQVGSELAAQFPDANRGRNFELALVSESRIAPMMEPMADRAGLLLLGIVGFVLLIACANVANLLLARAHERRNEIAVRLAMGATPGRVLRQLLTESLLISLLGGAIGIVLALWGVDLIWAMQPGEHWEAPPVDLGLDSRVLAFTLTLSLLTTLTFGLLPAWRSAHEPLVTALRADSKVAGADGRPPRLRRVLVAAQVALSLVAMVGAGLFVRSLEASRAVDPGFDVDATGVIELNLPADIDAARRRELYAAALSVANKSEGVLAAGLAEDPPMRHSVMRTVLAERAGVRGESGPIVDVNGVSEGYLDTIGLKLVRGEDFGQVGDQVPGGLGEDEHLVALVNETAARRLWPNEDALGAHFRFIGFPVSHRVIGIVGDSKVFTLHEDPQPMIYVWMAQQRFPRTSVVIRGEGDLSGLLPRLERELGELDPRVAAHGAKPLREVVEATLWGDRLGASLLSAFAALALLLASIGVYGLSSYVVTRRTREVGVRMALGADPGELRRLLVRQTLAPVLAGVAVGLLLALAASSLLEGMLYGVPLADPFTYLPAAGLLVLVALLAAWLPARRATNIDPMEALRR